MYRVYDNENKQWVGENTLLSSNNDLYQIRQSKINHNKYDLKLLSDRRYIYQIDIGLYDKEHTLIFEGDILQTNDGEVGLISYSPENASYVFLNYNENKYYPLGTKICSNYLKIVGNLFDTPELIPQIQEVSNDK